jgi:hypothetical protein
MTKLECWICGTIAFAILTPVALIVSARPVDAVFGLVVGCLIIGPLINWYIIRPLAIRILNRDPPTTRRS